MFLTLLEHIRNGSFDWVAAEAAGISKRSFYRWMERGNRGERPFAELSTAVRRAKAQARIGAEHWVRERNPLSWLRLGPGRERRGEPGWTQPVREPIGESPAEQIGDEDPALLQEIEDALKEIGLTEDGAEAVKPRDSGEHERLARAGDRVDGGLG